MTHYQVIETPHQDPTSAKVVASHATRHEALICSAKSMKANLNELCSSSLSAKELFTLWKTLGSGYRIEPEDEKASPFSDIDYARLFVLRLTNDYSHPLYFEITTRDCLRTASGVMSPDKHWKFWLRAPATYQEPGIEPLINPGVELLYTTMSEQSAAADGSSLILLETTFKIVSQEGALEAINSDASAILYFVQNDGSFSRQPQK